MDRNRKKNVLEPVMKNHGRFLFKWSLAALLAVATATLGACDASTSKTSQEKTSQEPIYQCPMHPDVTSDQPGDCPICGMRLVEVDMGDGSDEADPHANHAGGDGTDMQVQTEHEGHETTGVEGRTTVKVDARRRQLLGVRTSPARVTEATKTIRSVGFVEADEDRIHHVHVKVPGWIENVQVQKVGEPVRKGQPLFELYSPKLVATQEELLSAVRTGNKRAADAARERLRNWDIAPKEIAEIEGSGKARRTILFRSPMNGFVNETKAVHGMRVQEMTEVYEIQNLDSVWVMGKFYETDVNLLEKGRPAEVIFPNGNRQKGVADYVYPTIDPKTRFATVRLIFENEDFRLRPGMYVDLRYVADGGHRLVVPRDAVIRTGSRAIAFVQTAPGTFEPRKLDLGPEVDGGYVVYAGIDDGDEVVEQANFFIDSESSLKAALGKFSGGGHDH